MILSLPGSDTELAGFCVFHGFLLSSALVALSQSNVVSHQPARGTVSGDSAQGWEITSKTWPTVSCSDWVKWELYLSLLHQTGRQASTCMSTLLPLCIMQQVKYGSTNLCAIEIRGVVAKMWWSLERGAGNDFLSPAQIFKVVSVFGRVSLQSLCCGLRGGWCTQNLGCAACGGLLASVALS